MTIFLKLSSNKTLDLHVFLWLVRHAAISAYYILLCTFDQKLNTSNLSVVYTSSHFDRHLEAFWGAADLTVGYTSSLLRHETNMCVKHAKTRFVYTVRIPAAHADPPKGGPKKRITYDILIFLSPNGRRPPDGGARRAFRFRTGKHLTSQEGSCGVRRA